MAQLALSWSAYKNNICQGLCSLQQNEEYVDMTIAADGHYVKVHQLILSLVSPYIKDLIRSAGNCSHPVIFLNKVSYPTLVSILEYVYTGEVRLTQEALPDLMEAARELRIKGLEDMEPEKHLKREGIDSETTLTQYSDTDINLKKTVIREPRQSHDKQDFSKLEDSNNDLSDGMDTDYASDSQSVKVDSRVEPGVQYTVSNQGSLQMILNRYMYYLRYTSRKGPNGHRRWLCVNDNRRKARPGTKKCPAAVITEGNVVVKRSFAHNHPFHDQKILKKISDNAVYTTVDDAECFGNSKKHNTK